VYYNLAITGLSVAICFFIGAIEALSLLPQEIGGLSQTSGFWGFMYNFNINNRRVRHRGHVHRHLAGRAAHLALRAYRGKMEPSPPFGTPGGTS
jgi:hypothetical protein